MFGLKIIRTKNWVKRSDYDRLAKEKEIKEMVAEGYLTLLKRERRDCESLREQLNEEIKRSMKLSENMNSLSQSVEKLDKEMEVYYNEIIGKEFKD